jgi:hypothetical protein
MANSYLTFNETATPANQTKFTYSAWIKRSKLSADQTIFYNYKDSSNYGYMYFRSGDDLRYFDRVAGGDTAIFATTRKFRDTSAWYHLVLQVDTTQGTNTNRLKFYVNGVQETLAETTYPNQDQALSLPREGVRTIGASNGGSNLFEGYQSHVAFVDSTSPAYTTFGETDSTSGIWKFKSPSGVTWGNTGFHLKFENSAALGTDSSGNSSTFTVNGNLKQALDTPSNVYATFNPLHFQAGRALTMSNGNGKIASNQNNWQPIGSTLAVPPKTGKWYWEFSQFIEAQTFVGFISSECNININLPYQATDGMITYFYAGRLTNDGSETESYFTAISATTDVVGVALDMTAGTYGQVQFYLNGSPTGSAVALGSSFANQFVMPFAMCNGTGGRSVSINTGNGYFGTTAITSAGSNGNGSLFEYDVPSGYYALNTKNINTYG